MKVGDYVRTPKGITKIIDIRDEIIRNSANGNEVVIETNTCITDNGFSISNDYKSSPDIIDLIKTWDYINGSKVLLVKKDKDRDTWTIVLDNSNVLVGEHINSFKPIKSIVTKEQFSKMEYKVGE